MKVSRFLKSSLVTFAVFIVSHLVFNAFFFAYMQYLHTRAEVSISTTIVEMTSLTTSTGTSSQTAQIDIMLDLARVYERRLQIVRLIYHIRYNSQLYTYCGLSRLFFPLAEIGLEYCRYLIHSDKHPK
jgi:hypothetical protein